ncbi:MAG: acyl-CoA thioesterase [Porticoccaceae bacterium]
MTSSIHTPAAPNGDLALQVLALPKDTNAYGDIYGGWVLSQMDLAGMVLARRTSGGKVATVAVGGMGFLRPVPVGAVVSCYASLIETGRTSMHISVEVWIESEALDEPAKVSEGDFWYVAITADGKTRPIKKS